MDRIDFVIVIEEHAEVIDAAFHVDVLPRAARIVGHIHLKSLAVDVAEHIKLAFVPTYAGCPNTLSVDFLAVAEGESGVGKVETIEAIAPLLPVHKVFGVEYIHARHGVHRGSGQIIVVAYAQDVGVREFIVEKRIGEGAVAVIGCPRPLWGQRLCFRMDWRSHKQQRGNQKFTGVLVHCFVDIRFAALAALNGEITICRQR